MTNQTSSKEFIGSYDEAPREQKKNQYIGKGYRINFNTPKKIFKSLFMVHNETMNIWIHLFAAIVVVLGIGVFVWINTGEDMKERVKVELKGKFEEYVERVNMMVGGGNKSGKLGEIMEMLKLKYQEMKNMTSYSMDAVNVSITKIMSQIQKMLDESMIKLIEAKENFENKGAKQVMENIEHIGDNQTYFKQIKSHIKLLSDKFVQTIDSPTYDFMDLTESPNPMHISRWPVVAMMICALICLLCSALYHLFYPMSGKYYTVFSRLDYAGINILISGSIIPALYYGLYCHQELAKFYITCICIIAVILFTASLFQFMHTPKYRTLKSICYGSFGIGVSIPIFHMAINQAIFPDGDQFTFVNSIPLFLALGASYLGGLVVYTKKCPQRQKPGRYDICGHSHQIWHLAVVMGIFFTYLAALQNFDQRKRFPICPLP